MFDTFLDGLKRIIKSRLFPIAFIYMILFVVIINRLFVLQIVEGPTHAEDYEYMNTEDREIKSTRGNIYDRNGMLLASNTLSYSVVMEDSTQITSNNQRNAVVHKLIQFIENNQDTLDNPFYIVHVGNEEFEFTISGTALTRFKKKVYAYALVNDQLTEEQMNATAKDVYYFLKNGTSIYPMFGISDDYTIDEILKIMSVRYALFNIYPKFMQITVASQISEGTLAMVMENIADLPGVEIKQQTKRIYHDSIYFAHILGYTGLINADELEKLNKDKANDYYNSSDIIGKTGLEKEFEAYLGGTKGNEVVAVNDNNRVVEVASRNEPVAGNDIYLTIDGELQKQAYHILEKRIAGIFLEHLRPNLDYGTKGESASKIYTPIYEVYYSLFDNNIIDIDRLSAYDAESIERQVYTKFVDAKADVSSQLNKLLEPTNEITNNKAGDMEEYLDYIYKVLSKQDIILINDIDKDDATLRSYQSGKISLSKFLQYTLANNYVNLSKLGVTNYFNSEELYQKLIEYTWDILNEDSTFNKKIYRYLVFSYKLSGTEISLLLFAQGVLKYNEEDVRKLESGSLSAYKFMEDKIRSLEITPAMLALEPCSGSLVINDVNNGDVLAMVTYPSYDNNMLANKIDADFYNWLYSDNTDPWMNRPTTQLTAPGSTFKMVTAVAGLEEGVVDPYEKILDLGIFEKISLPAKCHIYPRSHGAVDMANALKVSCNYYFYETSYRLGIDSKGEFNERQGLSQIKKYASLFGLDTLSGVEIGGAMPNVSDKDTVRSSIGQGTNLYTPIQLSRYVTTIANHGTNYSFTLLDRIIGKDGNIVLMNEPEVYKELTDIKSSTWDTVRKGMYMVANEKRGSVYELYNNLGVTVAAKTGTSQISLSKPNNALFVSFAPYEKPEISVTVVIPNGHTSGNAAETARDIYQLYFNLGNNEELVSNEAVLPENDIAAFSD
ncbi:MAG: penicillin-binding transpeptidase domain-containing protein [Herbinix sp.]|nr:penicillin-binding transpeptidase domain-containing protein [Herbinix sp.]